MTTQTPGLRSKLGRARGLGSAKEGAHHWWMQRVTAIALIPLGLWFVATIIALAGAEYAEATAVLGNPLVAVLMVLTIVATFYHAQLGMQVIYEDYISIHWLRLTVDLATKFACFGLAVAAIFAVLKIAFGG